MPSLIDRTWIPPVARRQLGVFTSAQARDAGMSRRQVDYRIATGSWKRIVGRGLVLSDEDVTPRCLGVAAWLTRPGSILLGPAAAAFHGAPIPALSTVDVRTKTASGRTAPGTTAWQRLARACLPYMW